MKYILIAILLCLLVMSCRADAQSRPASKRPALSQKNAEIGSDVADSVFLARLPGKIFDFSATNDPDFCDKDSLVEGDCNSGYFYFTPKGNVIYHYLCVNAIEDDYCIGKPEFNEKGLLLKFYDYYSYKISDDVNGPTLDELNNGKLEKNKFSMQFFPLTDCPGSYGYIIDSEKGVNPEYYLIQEAKDFSLDEYPFKEMKEIKALQNY